MPMPGALPKPARIAVRLTSTVAAWMQPRRAADELEDAEPSAYAACKDAMPAASSPHSMDTSIEAFTISSVISNVSSSAGP